MPVSIHPGRDGRPRAYPHIILDRASPASSRSGRARERFTNEARSYHDFVLAMKERERAQGSSFRCFLLCDATALRKYGLGAVRPGARRIAPYLRSGYLRCARALAGLAASLSIPAATLERAIARFNADAARGVDGGALAGAPPSSIASTVMPIISQPLPGAARGAAVTRSSCDYADLAPSVGLRTDEDARVLDGAGAPIGGLYACGNNIPEGDSVPLVLTVNVIHEGQQKQLSSTALVRVVK